MWSAALGVRPGSESNESAWFGSEVTEWFVSGPAHVQVTESPWLIVTAAGSNAKFLIVTSAALAGAAAAASANSVAGIAKRRIGISLRIRGPRGSNFLSDRWRRRARPALRRC